MDAERGSPSLHGDAGRDDNDQSCARYERVAPRASSRVDGFFEFALLFDDGGAKPWRPPVREAEASRMLRCAPRRTM